MKLFGISLGDLAPVLIIIGWFVLSRWVLPRLGIRT